jgi:hypothetical protein
MEHMVDSFTDEKFSSGYVGFETYRAGSMDSSFYIDYTTLNVLDTDSTALSAMSIENVSAEQQALNAEALAHPQDSLDGYTE